MGTVRSGRGSARILVCVCAFACSYAYADPIRGLAPTAGRRPSPKYSSDIKLPKGVDPFQLHDQASELYIRENKRSDARRLWDMAADAEPDNPAVHEIRRDVFRRRREGATSLMARGIYGSAIASSKAALGE